MKWSCRSSLIVTNEAFDLSHALIQHSFCHQKRRSGDGGSPPRCPQRCPPTRGARPTCTDTTLRIRDQRLRPLPTRHVQRPDGARGATRCGASPDAWDQRHRRGPQLLNQHRPSSLRREPEGGPGAPSSGLRRPDQLQAHGLNRGQRKVPPRRSLDQAGSGCLVSGRGGVSNGLDSSPQPVQAPACSAHGETRRSAEWNGWWVSAQRLSGCARAASCVCHRTVGLGGHGG